MPDLSARPRFDDGWVDAHQPAILASEWPG